MLVYSWVPLTLPSLTPSNINCISVLSTGQSGLFFKPARCLSTFLLRVVVHYVSSTAEDFDFCSLGVRLHRLSALHQEDVVGEVRP